ncbi:hypothetical protein EC973_005287 [Apophysomyces ossiformis]|uniref:Uncharacterized protein n=1 Tax=Apophysomyces ossiformis TaxID=679940 RepID=A0A8H7BZD3_9FUNG|nr:hypothetical protein EC973_005287 [Apophysomyces ossiformis]
MRTVFPMSAPKAHSIEGYDYIFYTLPAAVTEPWEDLVEQMNDALQKIQKKIHHQVPHQASRVSNTMASYKKPRVKSS